MCDEILKKLMLLVLCTVGYPDPFKDDARSMPPPAKIPPPVGSKPGSTKIAQKLTTPTNSGPSTQIMTPSQLPTKLTANKLTVKPVNKTESQNISSSISPPDSPTQSSRHRRNVSDTSAFNKCVF